MGQLRRALQHGQDQQRQPGILRPERRALFTQAVTLPNCTRFVPVDFWQHARTENDAYHVMFGEAADGCYLAVFNWHDDAHTYRITGLGALAPVKVVGEGSAATVDGAFTVTLPGLHSVVYRLLPNASYEILRRTLRLEN